jgi:pectate lyase
MVAVTSGVVALAVLNYKKADRIWALIKTTTTGAANIETNRGHISTGQLTPRHSELVIEGFGRNTTGGTGGQLYKVTNLNDGGLGSFRDAVTRTGRRIVKFQISGTIFLKSDVHIYNGDLTIDGSDAPNQGVAIAGGTLGIYANNVIVRHMRFRLGSLSSNPGSADGVQIGSDNQSTASNVVLDHCSISWAIDENVSVVGGARNVTIQHCIISEPLTAAGHPKGNHGYGLLGGAGGPSESLTVHHTLFAHNSGRNPEFIDGDYDFVNNVIYNAGSATASFQAPWEGPMRVNWVGNYYKRGPSSWCMSLRCRPIRLNDREYSTQSYAFLEQNIDTATRADYDSPERNIYFFDSEGTPLIKLVSVRFDFPKVTTTDAFVAKDFVIANAGATLPCRDSVDRRVINDFLNGTGALPDTQEKVGGWPNLNLPC